MSPQADQGGVPSRMVIEHRDALIYMLSEAAELEHKARQLAAYSGAADAELMNHVIERVWAIADTPRVGSLLS